MQWQKLGTHTSFMTSNYHEEKTYMSTIESIKLNGVTHEIRTNSDGLTDDVKLGILKCFAGVAWASEDGQNLYNELRDALYPHTASQFVITNNLTKCTNSNSAMVIEKNEPYSATLTAESGYVIGSVTIEMGGADVTSSVYNQTTSSISIAAVTGNLTITAEAIADVG